MTINFKFFTTCDFIFLHCLLVKKGYNSDFKKCGQRHESYCSHAFIFFSFSFSNYFATFWPTMMHSNSKVVLYWNLDKKIWVITLKELYLVGFEPGTKEIRQLWPMRSTNWASKWVGKHQQNLCLWINIGRAYDKPSPCGLSWKIGHVD